MLTRRRFVGYSALTSAMLTYRPLLRSAQGESSQGPVRLAVIGNKYQLASDLQSIADPFMVGYPYNGKWHMPNVQVVSMYIEPKPHPKDMSSRGQGLTVLLSQGREPKVLRVSSNVGDRS